MTQLVSHHVDPTREHFEAFKALPRDTPILMLNLIRLREAAAYPDGRNATGQEAYADYGRESLPVFKRVGGSIVWRGRPEERWDIAFVARYPSAGAFLEMVTDPDYKAAVVHRQAAVDDSRLIRLAELPLTDAFA
jgi:uncharacterized protein (DUF1330 family)